jgi:hypothetical protein
MTTLIFDLQGNYLAYTTGSIPTQLNTPSYITASEPVGYNHNTQILSYDTLTSTVVVTNLPETDEGSTQGINNHMYYDSISQNIISKKPIVISS